MKSQMLAAYCLPHPNTLQVCNNDSFLFHAAFCTQISKHFPKKGKYNYACVRDGETETLRVKAICPRWQGKLQAESGINPASSAFGSLLTTALLALDYGITSLQEQQQ